MHVSLIDLHNISIAHSRADDQNSKANISQQQHYTSGESELLLQIYTCKSFFRSLLLILPPNRPFLPFAYSCDSVVFFS